MTRSRAVRRSASFAAVAGKTAPAKVRSTKNLKEGTKLKVRGCVQKKGKSYGCTDWYSAHA